uniref:HDC12014 n=1 Tax=Drosophila melanogaster TaxID=7227 RepID=Q6IKN9_DROME|nr:TPA_inf: HDC12014 [Drosophila melanogaster]
MKQTGRSRPNQSAANLIIHATEPTDTDAWHPADSIQQPGAQLLINCQSSYLILFNFIYSHCFISLDPGRSPNRKGFGGCIVPVCLLYRSIHVHFLLPFVYYVGFAGALGAWNVLPMPLMACNIERDIGPVDSQSFPFAARYRWLSWQILLGRTSFCSGAQLLPLYLGVKLSNAETC